MKNNFFISQKIKLYRMILIIGIIFYLSFGIFYQLNELYNDPISMKLRILNSLLLIIILILTYTNKFSRDKIFAIMYSILSFSLGYLVYFAYLNNFSFNYMLSIVLTIFIVNLIYENNSYLAYFNIVFNSVLIIVSYFADVELSVQVFFLIIVITVSSSSYLLAYSQKKLQEKSKKIAKRYRGLVTNMPIGLANHKVIFDENQEPIDHIFLEINQAFEKMTDLNREDIIGKKFTNILEDIEELRFNLIKVYGEVALTGEAVEFERYFEPFDKWYYITAYSQKKGYFTTTIIDITNRKKAEEDERKRSEELERFFTINLDLLCIADTEGNFIKVNKEWEKIFGYSKAELEEKKFLDFVHPDDLDDTYEAIERLDRQEEVLNFVNRFKDNTGDYHYIEWRSRANDNLIYAAARDITETRLSQNKIKEAKKMLEKMAEQVPGTIYQYQYFLDGSSCFPFASKGIYDVYEVKAEEVKEDASLVFERIYKKDYKKVSETIKKSAEEMAVWHEEYRVKLPNKGLCWVEGIAQPEKMKDGSVLWHGYIRDITERKEMEKKLKETAYKAKQANKAKGEFLANMSHEIRTPLNAVVGFSEILEKELTDSKQKKYLNSIKTASNSLLNLINDFLDMSKIEAGMLETNFTYFNLNDLLDEIETVFYKKIEEKGLELTLDLTDNSLEVKLDQIKLRQILFNLIGNAIKFTNEGQIVISIKANKKSNQKLDLEILVSDTGIGISGDKQNDIFELFTQQDGDITREYGGTGLGLAISKKLTELMGGKIDVESKEGIGSDFKLSFNNLDFRSEIKELSITSSQYLSNKKVKETEQKSIELISLSQELVKELRANFLAKVEEMEGTIIINEVEEFADDLQQFGKENKIQILIDYAKSLKTSLDGFAFESIETKIINFKNFIQKDEIKE